MMSTMEIEVRRTDTPPGVTRCLWSPSRCAISLTSLLVASCGHFDIEHQPGDAPLAFPPDDAPPAFLSCMGLPATCGAKRKGNCCESPEVMGGSFARGYDLASDHAYPDPSFRATISTFRLDKYEVTVGRFRAFVRANMGTQANPPAAGAGTHPRIDRSGWAASWNSKLTMNLDELTAALKCDYPMYTWTDAPEGHELLPVNCITWYEALAFCAWDGGFLPTEAESNYAAAGGAAQRAYPWSDPPETLSTLDGEHASYNCLGDGMSGCALTDLVEVGTLWQGEGLWLQSDLAGNVWEWALDSYEMPYPLECNDCANIGPAQSDQDRVLRGGSFDDPDVELRAGHRGNLPPTERGFNKGVRCARTL